MTLRELRSVIRADLSLKSQAGDRLTVAVFRLGQYTSGHPTRILPHIVYLLLDLVWTRIVVGAELPPSVVAGPGLRVRHWGRGVILHPQAVIGSRAYIYHRVTVGEANGATPSIGDRVYLGTGSSVIGRVTVGHGAKIGAGAVVVRDVAAGATAVGVPAHLRL